MLSAKTCGQHNKVIDSVSTIRLIVLISVVLSFLVGRGSLLIQCQEFEILFIPFISASILIICCAYINNVQSYAIICKIYPFCPFFFIFAAFLGKNRGHRRVFCHSKQLVLRPFAHRPLAQKLRNPCPDDLRNWRKFVADPIHRVRHYIRLFRHFSHLLRHIFHLVATPICRTCHYIRLFRHSTHPLRTSGRLVRHRSYLARHQLYVDFRA